MHFTKNFKKNFTFLYAFYQNFKKEFHFFICILPKKSYFRMLQVILDVVNLFRGGTNFAIVFGDDVIMTSFVITWISN